MKLKKGFLLHEAGGERMVVATGEAAELFNGLIRNNETAHFIYRELLQDTTEEKIADAMCEKYDGAREAIAADVHRVVEQLWKAGFLDE